MIGPGKYDDICLRVRKDTKAEGVVLIIMNGNKGFGMSIQVPGKYLLVLPESLRNIADAIEQDLKNSIGH